MNRPAMHGVCGDMLFPMHSRMFPRFLVIVSALLASSSSSAAEGQWEESATADIDGQRLVISSRSKPGSEVKEVRGIGVFDAPAWVVKNVIDDVGRYKEFMPYTVESVIISTNPGSVVSYQRLDTPVVDDRDYTIKIFDESREDVDGRVIWKVRWTEANALGPPVKAGVARVGVNEGYWILEEKDGGARTKATYYVYTNPGGSIPTFLVNMANSQAVPELFRAVNKASKDARYRATKPVPRTSEKRPPVPAPALAAPPPSTPSTP
jgi:hypothetical protein